MAFFRDFNVKLNIFGCQGMWWFDPQLVTWHCQLGICTHMSRVERGNHHQIEKKSLAPECSIFFVGCKIGAQLGNIWLGFLTIKLFRIVKNLIHFTKWTQVALVPQPQLSPPVKRRTRRTVTRRHSQHGLQGIQGCGAPSRNSCGAGGSKGDHGIVDMGWRYTGIFLIPWWMGIMNKGMYWDHVLYIYIYTII